MFTSFNEKQERYSTPRPSSPFTTPISTTSFNEINKPQLSSPSDIVKDNEGYIMFTENGGSILPANATLPGPYPSPPPPPTVYSFSLTYNATSCAQACYSSNTTVYYSLSSTLVASSKLYTDSALTTPVANGYYSEGSNSGNCYDITDSAGTINSVSACNITCWQYTYVNETPLAQEIFYTDCNGTPVNANIDADSSLTYCSNTYDPSTTGPCTL
jgi:hypothetical protein